MKRRSAFILSLGFVAAAPAAGNLFDSSSPLPWSLGFVSPAFAAEDVTFDNIAATFGGASLKIPHIAINGSSLSKADMEKLLAGPWGTASADTLAKFDATSIVIPEVDLTVTSPVAGKDTPMTQTLVYRDIHVDGLKGGKAARLTASGMSNDINGPVPMSYTSGAFLATDYDLAGAVRVVFAAAQPGEAPKQLIGPSSIDSMKFKGPEGVEVNIGRISAGAMRMRPLSTPIASSMQLAMAASTPDNKMPPA